MIIKYYTLINENDEQCKFRDASDFFNIELLKDNGIPKPIICSYENLSGEQKQRVFNYNGQPVKGVAVIRSYNNAEPIIGQYEKVLEYKTFSPVDYAIDNDTLAPVLIRKPTTFEEMQFLVSVDPRFLCQFDTNGLSEEQLDLLLDKAMLTAADMLDDNVTFLDGQYGRAEQELEDDFIKLVAVSIKKFYKKLETCHFEQLECFGF